MDGDSQASTEQKEEADEGMKFNLGVEEMLNGGRRGSLSERVNMGEAHLREEG